MKPVDRPWRRAVFSALAMSLGLHVGLAALTTTQTDTVQIEGGETGLTAALGSSFEDLLQAGGELSPTDGDALEPTETNMEQIEARQPTPQEQPSEPLPVERVEMPELTGPVQSAPTDMPPLPELTAPAPVESSETPLITPTPAVSAATALIPNLQQIASAEISTPSSDVAAIQPVAPQNVVEAEAERDVIVPPIPTPRPEGLFDPDLARLEALREAERQREEERPEREREAQRQTQSGDSQGNANVSARVGTAEGQDQGQASTASQSEQRSPQAGNAEVSNYPGRVYSRIQRTRQRPVRGSGTAQIQFTIAASGAVNSASVVTSSGSDTVDTAALNHVQRAAPFPPPPPGAQTRFIIPIEIRR